MEVFLRVIGELIPGGCNDQEEKTWFSSKQVNLIKSVREILA
jgi:hypothetical protein